MTRQVIIIGASSGIGATLAVDLSRLGYSLGLVARRKELLAKVAGELQTRTWVRQIDIVDIPTAGNQLLELIEEMGDVELVIISSGTGFENPELDWELEEKTINTNVTGFAAIANAAAKYLESRGSGHLVGISSIAAIRGNGDAPAYGASKAFVTNYLQALRHRFVKRKLPICVTEVQPGFVDTDMAKGDGLFWVAPVSKASRQIIYVIQMKRSHVYVTKRWHLIAWVLRVIPNWIYHRI